jgi:predicted extracellular nuclease
MMRILRPLILFSAFFAAAPVFGQKDVTIAQIQGIKNLSEHVGISVKTTGIVTARLRTGFFLQTPDNKIDGDPLSSEGVYVFTKEDPPADAAIGNEISVSGKVEEFRHRNENYGLTITEVNHFIGRDTIRVVSSNNPLPKPITLTLLDFKSNAVDQLEKYEGMRVTVPEMTSVAPTGGRVDAKTESVVSDGVFYAVVKGIPRPFREPGMSIVQLLGTEDRERDKWKRELPRLPFFDNNPEVIRVETLAQTGSSVMNVASKAEIWDVIGVLHYAYNRYAILTDATTKATVTNTIKPIVMPATTDRQFSIAAANIETFVDDDDDPDIREDVATTEAFQKRIGKISLAVRDYLQLPDVFAVVEAENLNVLKKLAAKVNADAVAARKPDPKYEAYLIDGNDPRGIDCGYLVKSSRVTVVSAKQFGKSEKFKNPVTGNDDTLNDRPPIMLELTIADPKTGQPFAFTIVNNHLKSFRGVDDPKDGQNVRMKKKLQAEFLAKWVNDRQKANPNERILLVGDFNAFSFNDGLVDQIGTIIGKPAPKEAVIESSPDLVESDLINLVNLIRADQQYSYTFDGNAQVLDHFLANVLMRKHLAGFGYLRINADYPQILRGVGDRPERFSDHDVAVGYFTFDAPAAN